MLTIPIERVSTKDVRVVKVYQSKIILHPNYLEWVESLDVEKKVPIDSDLENDEELQVVPEYSYCVVDKKSFVGIDIDWDQEELMFLLTIVAQPYRFTVYNESKEKLIPLFNSIKEWLFENKSSSH